MLWFLKIYQFGQVWFLNGCHMPALRRSSFYPICRYSLSSPLGLLTSSPLSFFTTCCADRTFVLLITSQSVSGCNSALHLTKHLDLFMMKVKLMTPLTLTSSSSQSFLVIQGKTKQKNNSLKACAPNSIIKSNFVFSRRKEV